MKFIFVALGSIFVFSWIVLSGWAQRETQNTVPTLRSQTTEFDQEIAESSKVIKRYWKAAQAGEFDEARILRTNTSDGFTIVETNGGPSWEHVINETGLEFLQLLEAECSENRCRVLVLISNRNGKELRLVHEVVKFEAGWRIRFISY